MIVRFLGGPCHNQYRDIRRPLPERVPVAVTEARFFDPKDDNPIADGPQAIEHYQLRHASPGGVYAPGRRPEHPVYVHPDYDGPVSW